MKAPATLQGISLVVSCEHGGNRVPEQYRALFRSARGLLASHRGYDPGALVMARAIARAFAAPLVAATVTRLLIELNRSPDNRRLYSEVMEHATREVREAVFARYYLPYRAEVEATVAQACARGGRVVHVSSHSFTPRLDGVIRTADIGLLYDPARGHEAALCARWQAALRDHAPAVRVRRNYPYLGSNDGLTTYLRTRFPDRLYCGIELEINQRFPLGDAANWRKLRATVISALRIALNQGAKPQAKHNFQFRPTIESEAR